MTETRQTKRQRSPLLERSSLLLPRKSWRRTFLVLEYEVEDLSILSIRWGEDQTFLLEGWGALHPVFLSFQQDLSPSPREKGSLLLPTEG